MISLRDWNIGDSVRNNEHHQQAVLALRELQRKAKEGGKRPPFRTQFIGKIVEHGKDFEGFDVADYADCRYWIEMQFIPGAGVDDAITFDTDTSMKVPGDAAAAPAPYPRNIITATNLAEYENDTHTLAVDGTVKVLVTAFYDTGSTANQLHYVFSSPIQNPFVVYVTIDSAPGSEGDNATTCTLTYTVADEADNELGTAMTPDAPARYANCEYRQVADGSPAIGYYTADGTFHLMFVPGEIPVGDLVQVQTNTRIDGTSLQMKTRNVLVLEAGDESDWTEIDPGTVCPTP